MIQKRSYFGNLFPTIHVYMLYKDNTTIITIPAVISK